MQENKRVTCKNIQVMQVHTFSTRELTSDLQKFRTISNTNKPIIKI